MVDLSKLEEKLVCSNCVAEEFLRHQVKLNGRTGTCGFCNSKLDCITIGCLANLIKVAFDQHFERIELDADGNESDIDARLGITVKALIQAEAVVEEDVASAFQKLLYERTVLDDYGDKADFHNETKYKRTYPHHFEWQTKWRSLETSLKNRNRFFNSDVALFLQRIFNEIDTFKTSDGSSVVTICGPGNKISQLYRARAFQTDKSLSEALKRPAKWLGPPSENARAGRMNAQGVSVFYGSTGPDAAVAEVRPPVGSKVAVAKFDIQQEIKLLDLNALANVEEEGSIFDANYAERLKRSRFLKTFCERITMPIMPEAEGTDYIITQAIADYLAEAHFDIDGIIYPSSQAGNADIANVVLFHKSSRASSAADGTYESAIYMHGEEDIYSDYNIKPVNLDPEGWGLVFDTHTRPQILKLDEEAIVIKHITAVRFECLHFDVKICDSWDSIQQPGAV